MPAQSGSTQGGLSSDEATENTATEANVAATPPRVMGFRDLVLFYVVTGMSLRWIATAAAVGPSSIVIWILAWITFYIPLAFCVLELSSRFPDEGGFYMWSKRAFGAFAGFMAAWIYWTCQLPYFAAVLTFAASNALFIGGERWEHLAGDRLYFILFPLLALGLSTALNVIGLNRGKWLHSLGALGMWLPVPIVVALGTLSWLRFGSATPFTYSTVAPDTSFEGIVFWYTMTYAFGGCEAASFMGGEIKNPRRTIPRALLAGGALVTIAYIAGTFFVLLALPGRDVNELQGLIQAIELSARRLGLAALIPVAAVLITLSNVSASGAFLAASARLPFVAGLDRYLPAIFGRLHPKWRTPHVALWTQCICATLFVCVAQVGTSIRGAYKALVSLEVITYFIPFLFLFASMIKLQGEPPGPGVIRVPGGKPVGVALALLGFITTSLTILFSLLPGPGEVNKVLAVAKVLGLTAILLGLGALVYFLGRSGASHRQSVAEREAQSIQ